MNSRVQFSPDDRPLIAVVDDDESVRESLPDLLRELGFTAHAFSSAQEYLDSAIVDDTKCLLLDVIMPDMSGPQLQEILRRNGKETPVVFMTAKSNEATRNELLNQCASECLFKPFGEAALLNALKKAMKA